MLCPDCILKMKEERRNAGKMKGVRVFLVCPNCGYNVPKCNVKYYEDQDKELYKRSKIKDEENE